MRKQAMHFCVLVTLASPAISYDKHDAQYVTTSKNPSVLNYVVCLEREVRKAPAKSPILQKLRRAELECAAAASKLPHTRSEPTATDILDQVLECGFRKGDASPDMGC